jgi:hypothetical protein
VGKSQVVQVVLGGIGLLWCFYSGFEWKKHRANAMDLCVWHARAIFNDDPNSVGQRWIEVRNGLRTCPFCGQKHNIHWVSRNGWDSQINAMIEEDK